MKKCCLLLLVCMMMAGSSRGWWDTGHMLVAQVGYDLLTQGESTAVKIALANAFDALQTYYADSGTFVTAACWMDDLKKRGVPQFNNWHYINIPVCEFDNMTICDTVSIPQLVSIGDNIVWAIQDNINTIKSSSAGGFERGFAMKTLLHLVGDIHQPLHCVDRYSVGTPNGDQGGNQFHIKTYQGATNLHQLWDSGAGLFDNSLIRPMSDSNKTYIQQWANKIISQLNISNIPDQLNITAWALESIQLSQTYVYNMTIHTLPSPDYISAAHDVILHQIGVAGYRLAQLLKQIVLCDSITNNCPVSVPTTNTILVTPKNTGYTAAVIVLSVALAAALVVIAVVVYNNSKKRVTTQEELPLHNNNNNNNNT